MGEIMALASWAERLLLQRYMRPVYALLIYLGIVFLGGALLAPWVYWGGQGAASKWMAFQSLAGEPFHRFVNRSWIVLALVGLRPFLRVCGMSTWKDVGFGWVPNLWRCFGWGLVLGFGSLALVVIAGLTVEARVLVFDRTIWQITAHLAPAGLSAAVVALIEEVLFRGAIYGALRRSMQWQTALVFSSLFYALVHFFQRPEPPDSVGWVSGLALLPRMMRGFGDVHQLLPAFLSLSVAGVLLGLAYQRTGNLLFSIGLHAGWIFWLKSYAFLTNEGQGANVWFWGSGKLIDGWFSFFVMSAVLIGCWRMLRADPDRSSHETVAKE